MLSSEHGSEAEVYAEAILEDGEDYTYELTLEEFDEICAPLFNKILPLIEGTLSQASIAKSQIDAVVLVGGTTRVPRVR